MCLDIRDDGAGINPTRLKEKAVAKGMISPEAAGRMGDREALRLIFHPGFSTAAELSDVSGRGVGMDVVRTNIEKLGWNSRRRIRAGQRHNNSHYAPTHAGDHSVVDRPALERSGSPYRK